ncbi:MAG: hypothetical protein VW082_00605 [Candidatus Nanopelagicales bacterium]
MRKVLIGVVAAALVGAGAVTAATPAAAAVSKVDPFSVMADLGPRVTFDSGREDGVGNLSVTTGKGTVNGGKATVVIVDRVVAPGSKKDSEVRDNQVTVVLSKGTVIAEAVDEDPKGGKPETLHILPVVGGTGAYASARGTLLMRPVGSKYLLAYDLFADKKMSKKSFSFAEPVSTNTASGGPRGLASINLTRAEQGDLSYVAVTTILGARKAPKYSMDLQVFDGASTIFARGLATSLPGAGKPVTLSILGGTGDYIGNRGELTLSADGTSIAAKLATPGGTAKSLPWTNRGKTSYDDSTVLGEALYEGGSTKVGKLTSVRKPRAKTSPVYSASLLTYPEIGGVQPVVTMIEQTLPTGTMLITGMSLVGSDGPLAVVGGVGDYGGAMGELTRVSSTTAAGKATSTFWR